MKTQFPTSSIKLYYFIKDNVIFNIAPNNPNNDPCAIPLGGGTDDEKLPSLTVQYNDGINQTKNITYYLTDLIADGDKKTTTQGTCIFKKTIHETGETLTSYVESLHDECINTIKNIIKTYPNVSNDFLRTKIKQKLPAFMYVEYIDAQHTQKQYNITSSTEITNVTNIQIDILNDQLIDNLKIETTQEEIYKIATNKANQFGFNLTKPSNPTEIEIEKK